jgi:hypothetical protein
MPMNTRLTWQNYSVEVNIEWENKSIIKLLDIIDQIRWLSVKISGYYFLLRFWNAQMSCFGKDYQVGYCRKYRLDCPSHRCLCVTLIKSSTAIYTLVALAGNNIPTMAANKIIISTVHGRSNGSHQERTRRWTDLRHRLPTFTQVMIMRKLIQNRHRSFIIIQTIWPIG